MNGPLRMVERVSHVRFFARWGGGLDLDSKGHLLGIGPLKERVYVFGVLDSRTFHLSSQTLNLRYIYIYIYMDVYIYIYTYIYIHRFYGELTWAKQAHHDDGCQVLELLQLLHPQKKTNRRWINVPFCAFPNIS